MKLYINSVEIQVNNNPVKNFLFAKGFTVVRNSVFLQGVLDAVLFIKSKFPKKDWVSFKAVVTIDKQYIVTGVKESDSEEVNLRVFFGDIECTCEYSELIELNAEVDSMLEFSMRNSKVYPKRLHQYRNQDLYNLRTSLSALTFGYSDTRTFLRVLREYIGEFSPVFLSADRKLGFDLLPNGEFKIYDNFGSVESFIESEEHLCSYLSYLYINDFWSKAEELRNMNRVEKPLLISGFTKNTYSSDMFERVLCHTASMERQSIIFAPLKEYHAIKEAVISVNLSDNTVN